ncbi:hypothetical protein B9T59_18315 [Escherichia coli]|nr:hypothetical protein [Escherichia coli]AWR82831.1 hypothetical protein B9T59_18315 [Escherichia coli]
MIFESDQYYDGFPHAISSENEEKTSFNDYALVNTLAECLYHDISREIFDGSEPALRAVIANGQIKFLARYTLRGACYYEPSAGSLVCLLKTRASVLVNSITDMMITGCRMKNMGPSRSD